LLEFSEPVNGLFNTMADDGKIWEKAHELAFNGIKKSGMW